MSSADDQRTGAGSATATEETATARDERREELLDAFRRELGDAVVAHHIRPGDDLWIRVATDGWLSTAEVARRQLGYGYFCFLSALDWLPSPFGRYEDAEVDTPLAAKMSQPGEVRPGYTGSDTRLQVFARVINTREKVAVTLKVDVPDDTMTIDSWVPVYAGANWHERETWEMFGITFRGHPNLIHIYLPGDFEGFPLRKDFPLLARVVKPWPGIVDVEPMPDEEEEEGEGEEGEGEEGEAVVETTEHGETAAAPPDATTAEATSPQEAPAPQPVETSPSGQKEEPTDPTEGGDAVQPPGGAADEESPVAEGRAGEAEGRVAQDDSGES